MTRVKICGLTNISDALFAAGKGADFLGFVFYDRSPRNVTPELVRRLVIDLKSAHPYVKCVGLFVDDTVHAIGEVLDFCALDLAQLHGEESAANLAVLKDRAFKAIRPRSLAEADISMALYAVPATPPDLLVDTFDARVAGGSGRVGDWDLAAYVAARRDVFLAGGLTPDNVGEAIRMVKPWGVDVSSGVEAQPGRKSHRAITEFIGRVRTIQEEKEE